MTFEKGTLEFSMMQDFFLLVKKYAIPKNTDKYWADMVEEFDAFEKKYRACDGLALNLGLAFMNNRDKNRSKYYDVTIAQEKQ